MVGGVTCNSMRTTTRTELYIAVRSQIPGIGLRDLFDLCNDHPSVEEAVAAWYGHQSQLRLHMVQRLFQLLPDVGLRAAYAWIDRYSTVEAAVSAYESGIRCELVPLDGQKDLPPAWFNDRPPPISLYGSVHVDLVLPNLPRWVNMIYNAGAGGAIGIGNMSACYPATERYAPDEAKRAHRAGTIRFGYCDEHGTPMLDVGATHCWLGWAI